MHTMTTRTRTFVLTALAIIVFFGCSYLYMRLFAGNVQQRLGSPTGKFIAEVRNYDKSPATEAAQVMVQLRTTTNPFRHTVFLCLNYGGSVTIGWKDTTTLQVDCTRCENLRTYKLERNWAGVVIRYSPEIGKDGVVNRIVPPQRQLARNAEGDRQ